MRRDFLIADRRLTGSSCSGIADEIIEWLVDEHCPIEPGPAATGRSTSFKRPPRRLLRHRRGVCPSDFDKDGPADILEGRAQEGCDHRRGIRGQARAPRRVGSPSSSKWICLQVLDAKWKDHLYALDRLKEGIGLRGYGQRNPLVEYKRESFEMFSEMNDRIQAEAVRYAFRMEPMTREQQEAELARRKRRQAARAEATARAGCRARLGRQPVGQDRGQGQGQRRSDETIPALAAAVRNTRSVTALRDVLGGSGPAD